MSNGDRDIYRGQVDQRTPLNVALCAIWYRLWQLTGFSASGGGIVAEANAEATAANPAYSEGQNAPLSQDLSGHLRTTALTDAQLRATPVPVSGTVTETPLAGTLTMVAAVASSTTTIPIGAFNIGIVILTGTGTVGGVDLPLGLPLNIASKTAAAISVVLANPGTARISYLS